MVVADVDESQGEKTVREIAARGRRALFVRTNVAVESEVRAAIRASEDEFGGLDIVINNASAPVPTKPLEGWSATIAVDLLGTLHVTRPGLDRVAAREGVLRDANGRGAS